ncbi:hypothetical protein LPH44_11970 (plasmid) [Xylella taiwanensis]|uniref:Lipoprotein n=1 Tax=Xylella taiwanensis TaxID=1444770 RepID=A0ABS8TVS6_9GAMM|nr:hypothetical protein [Xylella taiwanensis]MCD8459783.1 hypothetical protein [Xylella taiwanensis]MCD8474172.1 hypothetical protein [Xylella taiwanensis]UFN08052.1 hypothetical protein LPH42_11990 [Xylella taiwanensis]UFN10345.1 hypothetical protein LPH45_11995 [Xylella taiwanensis]UFN12633.1 hypothetical protein LPH44_11970 [Xylella taiwanensis]
MQRVQTFRLLMVFTVLLMGACSREKVPSTSEYLHDIDSARAMLKLAATDPAKYENDPRWTNASAAIVKLEFLRECWTKPISTATTDHACLDKEGFKR